MILIAVIRVILYNKEQSYNDFQPITPSCARIISKRKDGEYRRSGARFVYIPEKQRRNYIKFEFASTKQIKEFCVPDNDYEKFFEEDIGTLNLQGTRYISFELQ